MKNDADVVCKPENADQLADDMLDMTCRIREAIAANRANSLSANKLLIPRTLRAAAMSILRVQWLTRFALNVSDDRRRAAEEAEALLKKVAAAQMPVIDEEGNIPRLPAQEPGIIAPSPAYGHDGTGFFPTPN